MSQGALDPDSATVQLNEALRESQTETGPLALAETEGRLLELFEDPVLISKRDAWPRIRHRDQHLIAAPRCRDDDPAARRGELDRIRQQVEDNLAEPPLVAPDDVDVRRQLEIDPDQGRRYSWGYPACPDQSEHEKVWRLLGLESIGMTLSGGYAVMPEQSTVAIIAHHPQAVYFGMKSGFIPAEKSSDELIAGTDRGGDLPPEDDPDEAGDEAKAEPVPSSR